MLRVTVDGRDATAAPPRGLRQIMDDIKVDAEWIVAPEEDKYPLRDGIQVTSPELLLENGLL